MRSIGAVALQYSLCFVEKRLCRQKAGFCLVLGLGKELDDTRSGIKKGGVRELLFMSKWGSGRMLCSGFCLHKLFWTPQGDSQWGEGSVR